MLLQDFFICSDFMEIGHVMNEITELCLHAVLLFSAVFAFNQMRHLDINEHPISLLDDVLLFICLPAFFIETALSLYATISLVNIVRSINFCLMVSFFLITSNFELQIVGMKSVPYMIDKTFNTRQLNWTAITTQQLLVYFFSNMFFLPSCCFASPNCFFLFNNCLIFYCFYCFISHSLSYIILHILIVYVTF